MSGYSLRILILEKILLIEYFNLVVFWCACRLFLLRTSLTQLTALASMRARVVDSRDLPYLIFCFTVVYLFVPTQCVFVLVCANRYNVHLPPFTTRFILVNAVHGVFFDSGGFFQVITIHSYIALVLLVLLRVLCISLLILSMRKS